VKLIVKSQHRGSALPCISLSLSKSALRSSYKYRFARVEKTTKTDSFNANKITMNIVDVPTLFSLKLLDAIAWKTFIEIRHAYTPVCKNEH